LVYRRFRTGTPPRTPFSSTAGWQLYLRLNRAADNIEKATRHLEPLLADARVFMDKIARNPRQLGVQGALDRERSGLKIPRPREMPLFSEEWYWTE